LSQIAEILIVFLVVCLAIGAIFTLSLTGYRLTSGLVNSPSRVRRHLAWVVPLALNLLVMVVVYSALPVLRSSPRSFHWISLSYEALGVIMAWATTALALAIITIPRGWSAYRYWQRSKGHLNRTEAQIQTVELAKQRAWRRAAKLRQAILAGEDLPGRTKCPEVVTRADELFLGDGPITYARYLGMEVFSTTATTDTRTTPEFVQSGRTIAALSERPAKAMAREQWRLWTKTRLLASNQRLCILLDDEWQSFDYKTMSGLYPDLKTLSLICQFRGKANPLLVTGPVVLVACVAAISAAQGVTGLRNHPSFRPFDSPITD
jgi:hypothetical protein